LLPAGTRFEFAAQIWQITLGKLKRWLHFWLENDVKSELFSWFRTLCK
jgi:hypothetical protein